MAFTTTKTIRIRLFFCIALFWHDSAIAQHKYVAPQVPKYTVVNQTGATLNQIVAIMYAHADSADTDEGGEREEIADFFRRCWCSSPTTSRRAIAYIIENKG